MRKVLHEIIFKYVELKVWLYEKRNGTPFEMFQFGLFWMVVITLSAMLIGKIL